MSADEWTCSVGTEPPELCGLAVLRWLTPGRTALCRVGDAQLVVLKELEEECLLDGTLHPEIRDRLSRIRELAHAHVATLIGVVKAGDGRAYSQWIYVEGTDLETWAADSAHSTHQVYRLLREVVLAVESLHGLGLVHGQLKSANILVEPAGEVKLLDISPRLYWDPQGDVDDLAELILRIVEQRGDSEGAIGRQLRGHIEARDGLREFSACISRSLHEAGDQPREENGTERGERRSRRKALFWLWLCVVAGAAVAVAGWWVLTHDFAPVALPQSVPPEALKPR